MEDRGLKRKRKRLKKRGDGVKRGREKTTEEGKC